MKVLLGPLKGMDVVPHQFGPDWITVDDEHGAPLLHHGRPAMVRPDQVELTTDADRALFTPTPGRNDGVFWHWWELTDDGRFVRRTDEGRPRLPRRQPAASVPAAERRG